MVSYANVNQRCIDASLTPFMQYLPYLLTLEAVVIILIEKALMKFPRVSGKIERFYGSIVEESLFGKMSLRMLWMIRLTQMQSLGEEEGMKSALT